MPRDIPVGNGSLLVNFDRSYQLRDFYWPHVGQENHTAGHPFRFGVWLEGEFRWVDDAGWKRTLQYVPDTLITKVTLQHDDLALTLVCQDAVDFYRDLYLRQIVAYNQVDRDRELRLFFRSRLSHQWALKRPKVKKVPGAMRKMVYFPAMPWLKVVWILLWRCISSFQRMVKQRVGIGLLWGKIFWRLHSSTALSALERTRSYWALWATKEASNNHRDRLQSALYYPSQGFNLGERMHNAFMWAFGQNYKKA